MSGQDRHSALEKAYHAMRQPHSEDKDYLENKALPIARAALALAREGADE